MHNTLDVEKRIQKSKVGLILNNPWFGQLAMRLIILDGTAQGVDTMATDGTHLFYHAPFVMSLSDVELTGVMAHEIMHCAMLHPYRRDNREPVRWNIACDYVINQTLVNSGFTLPKGALMDAAYSGLSAEKAYAMLPQPNGPTPPPPPPGGTDGHGKPGKQPGKPGNGPPPEECPWGKVLDSPKPGDKPGDTPGGAGDKPGDKPGKGKPGDKPGQPGGPGAGQPGDGPGETIRTESDWVIDTIQAEKIATGAGKMPGGIGTSVRQARETRTNYREALKRFMDKSVPVDYTWARPNRRLLGQGIVVPGIHRENCGELVIGIDTSGSVHSGMLDQFGTDVRTIIAEYKPTKTYVVYCDTRVTHVAEFEPDGVPFEFEKRVSRGGTYFQPVFDWVEEQGLNPRALIYLTDLEPADHPVEPTYPVLWGVPETCTRKGWEWGETVEITMDRR